MKFIVRPQLAWTLFIFGLTHAMVFGGFLIWSQRLKFVDFGAYVILGGEDGGLAITGTIFLIVDIVIAVFGVWFMRHAEIS